MEGQWNELGTAYHDEVRRYVSNLLSGHDRSLDLPAWQVGDAERDYNVHGVGVRRCGYVCLDWHGAINSSEVRGKFAALVSQEGSGRTIPEDFVPK